MTIGHQQPRPSRYGRGRRPTGGSTRHGARAAGSAVIDLAEADLAAGYELPGAELAPEEHTVEILAEQADEFTCGACFLVRHRSQLAKEHHGVKYCQECFG